MNGEMPARGSILYVVGISMIAALGGFLFGFDMTVISGAVPFLKYVFHLNGAGLGWAVSSCILACVFGAASAGKLADVLGRKKVLIGTAVLFAVSAVGAGWSTTFNGFIFFRLLGGLAIGAASGVAPIYVAETAPTRFRGRFVSFYQLAIVIGLLASYVSNYLLLATGDDAWRWMFAAGVVPAALFFFLLFLVPETPRWLVKSGHESRAMAVLARIDGADYAAREMVVIRQTLQVRKGRLADLLQPRMARIVVIGALLGIFSQISGANAVFTYAPVIFSQAAAQHDSDETAKAGSLPAEVSAPDNPKPDKAQLQAALLKTALIGVINFFATFLPILLVERVGRRPLLLAGVACMAVSMAGLCSLYTIGSSGVAARASILAAVLVFIAAYSSSLACLTWVILSEIFPNRIRGEAMSVANLALWTANYVLLQTFPMIEERFGLSSTFGAYAIICCTIFLFVWKFIPETKGKSLEEIEIELVGLPPKAAILSTR
jgi:MFS transporter, SP family, arabinose:H+ symporter